MRHVAAFLLIFCLAPLTAFAANMSTVAKQAIIIDAQTGQVLFEKNPNEKMPTSSMSKTMTMYMVFEALKEGRVKLDDEFEVSERAWRMGGSKMFVELGKKIKLEDLIQGVIVQSGNDATVVIAEGLAGSEGEFALQATRKAHEMGMKDSNFVNASGWPDPDHYSTAHDLAILGLRTIEDFPEYYKYYAEKEFTYHNIKQQNRNPLLYKNIGADGVKTGHTESGGFGLIGSGVMGGRRVVMVLNGMKDMAERSQESARLLEWALRAFENVKLFSEGETVETAPVVMGQVEEVPLTIEKDMIYTLPMGSKNEIQARAVFEGPLVAPVAKGQRVGKLEIIIPGMDPAEVPLIAAADVPHLGFFKGALEKAKLHLGL